MTETNKHDMISAKVIFVGESGTGKTCIIQRIITQEFTGLEKSTTGAQTDSRVVEIDGKHVRIQIWDTAGQEKYRAMVPIFFKNTSVAIVTYAINDQASFDHVNTWLDILHNEKSDMKAVLVANKCDLESERVISRQIGEKKANDEDMLFFEVSALSGDQIEELFYSAASLAVEQQTAKAIHSNEVIIKNELQKDKKQSSCC